MCLVWLNMIVRKWLCVLGLFLVWFIRVLIKLVSDVSGVCNL